MIHLVVIYFGIDSLKQVNPLSEAKRRIYAPVNYPILVKIMGCRLIGAKPLSEPLMDYC